VTLPAATCTGTFTTVDGPALRVVWDGGDATVAHR
jgi:hypothetical protein